MKKQQQEQSALVRITRDPDKQTYVNIRAGDNNGRPNTTQRLDTLDAVECGSAKRLSDNEPNAFGNEALSFNVGKKL